MAFRERIDQDYPANENFPPAEQFAASNQFWFGAPTRELSDTGRALMEDIFTGQKTFSCDTYESDVKFLREIGTGRPQRRVDIQIQIDDEVEVFLNGESVFQNAILRHGEPQIEVDLSDQLVSGTNVIQVEATNGPGSATLLGSISVDGEVIDEWSVLTQSNVDNPFVDGALRSRALVNSESMSRKTR